MVYHQSLYLFGDSIQGGLLLLIVMLSMYWFLTVLEWVRQLLVIMWVAFSGSLTVCNAGDVRALGGW